MTDETRLLLAAPMTTGLEPATLTLARPLVASASIVLDP
jgi:hypothetical protein